MSALKKTKKAAPKKRVPRPGWMKLKIVKATPEQAAEYNKDSVYPLYGYITNSDGVVLPIEDLRKHWGKEDPVWEVMAPDNKVFARVYCHSLLCYNLTDLRERVWCYEIEDCDYDQCGCSRHDEKEV